MPIPGRSLVLERPGEFRIREADAVTPPPGEVVVDPTISCGRCRACRHGDPHVCESLRLAGVDRPGGLAAAVCVAEDRLHPVPAGLPLAAAALAEPLAVAVHAAGVPEIIGLAGVAAALGRLSRGESLKALVRPADTDPADTDPADTDPADTDPGDTQDARRRP